MRRTWTAFLLATVLITGCGSAEGATVKEGESVGGAEPTQYRHLIKKRIQEKYTHPQYLKNVSISDIHIALFDNQYGWMACVDHQPSEDGIEYDDPVKMLFWIQDNKVQSHGIVELCNNPKFHYQKWPEMEAGYGASK